MHNKGKTSATASSLSDAFYQLLSYKDEEITLEILCRSCVKQTADEKMKN